MLSVVPLLIWYLSFPPFRTYHLHVAEGFGMGFAESISARSLCVKRDPSIAFRHRFRAIDLGADKRLPFVIGLSRKFSV